jgi:hypothetical protein
MILRPYQTEAVEASSKEPDLSSVARASELLEQTGVAPGVACVENYRGGRALESQNNHPRCSWGIKHGCRCGGRRS